MPPASIVANDLDPLRDTGHKSTQIPARASNRVGYVHYDDFTHSFIQSTEKSRKDLTITREIGRDMGAILRGQAIDTK